MNKEEFLQQTYDARDKFVNTLGDVKPDLLVPPINPSFYGGPAWPNLRQSWRVIRRGSNTIIISDGLSDPFENSDEPNVGLGLEVLVETPDALPEQLQACWLFDVVEQVSQQCATHGGIRKIFDRNGLISLELPLVETLAPVASENSTAGVLLGVPPESYAAEFQLPGGLVKVLTAKLLWPTELAYAVANRKPGREELAKRFAADGTHHRSSLVRNAVA